MAQAVIRWPLTTKVRVRFRFSPCVICSEPSGTGLSLNSSGFPCQHNSKVALHTHMHMDEQYARYWPKFGDIVDCRLVVVMG
jgi:hypothetical protein